MSKVTGVVFYEGPSRIDGKPIVGIATLNTENTKTGNLVQTWILRSDIPPIEAINNGEDVSICGDCPLRGYINGTNKGRGCYVAIHQAPYQIFKSYKGGKYPKLDSSHRMLMIGKGLRYGSYGDPVAIPMKFWKPLLRDCTGKAEPGYTHQWRKRRFQRWAKILMASTHSLAQNELANSMGWRTFRTIVSLDDIAENEIICPASAEGGYKANCATCGCL